MFETSVSDLKQVHLCLESISTDQSHKCASYLSQHDFVVDSRNLLQYTKENT